MIRALRLCGIRGLLSALMVMFSTAWSATFVLPTQGDLVGEIQNVHPEIGETLSDVGGRYGIGYYEITRANPRVDPIRPLSPETHLIIPSQFILPRVAREGIVINLAEYRLYYYPPGENVVITMPVGIGREGWTTPIGLTKVVVKERDPVWRPTANVRAEAAKNGVPIPNVFPPGEGNPLGRHILRLGWPSYLIHGTNRRDGVGSRVSAGCIRMKPEDIEYLYDLVSVGTPVRVINEPVKIGWQQDRVYMQMHLPLVEQKDVNLKLLAQQALEKLAIKTMNNNIILQEIEYPTGIPKKIS